MEALRELLASDDELQRLTAAGALVLAGEKEALPIIIDLLDSDAPVPYSDPPKVLRYW